MVSAILSVFQIVFFSICQSSLTLSFVQSISSLSPSSELESDCLLLSRSDESNELCSNHYGVCFPPLLFLAASLLFLDSAFYSNFLFWSGHLVFFGLFSGGLFSTSDSLGVKYFYFKFDKSAFPIPALDSFTLVGDAG